MTRAPSSPTTQELHNMAPLSTEADIEIARTRQEYSEIMSGLSELTFGIAGYCARPGIERLNAVMYEGGRVSGLASSIGGCALAHRGPPWKPRSNPNDYSGEDTTDPIGAYLSVKAEAEAYAHVAAEIGYFEMMARYVHMLSFAWSGGRNINDVELIESLALYDTALPLGIKHGLDGDVKPALVQVESVNELRNGTGAPAILIYRGGTNATCPESWEQEYLTAHELTSGRLIVDVAHGSEMAHDPENKFRKTIDGQILALGHVIDLARMGFSPVGIMVEASDLVSRTDPHMPLQIALDGLSELVSIKMSRVSR